MPGRREFIERLVAAADEAMLHEPATRRTKLARWLVAEFVPDVQVFGYDLRRWIVPGVEPKARPPEDLAESWDVRRFPPELIAGGQGAEALRHIAAGAAAVLARRTPLVWAANVLDWIQGLVRGNRREARAEVAGNLTGARLGRALRAYLEGAVTREALERTIRDLLT